MALHFVRVYKEEVIILHGLTQTQEELIDEYMLDFPEKLNEAQVLGLIQKVYPSASRAVIIRE